MSKEESMTIQMVLAQDPKDFKKYFDNILLNNLYAMRELGLIMQQDVVYLYNEYRRIVGKANILEGKKDA